MIVVTMVALPFAGYRVSRRLVNDHAARITQLEERHSAEVAQLEERHSAEVTQLEERLELLVHDYTARVAQHKERHSAEVAQLEERHSAEVAQLEERHSAEVDQPEERLARLVNDHTARVTQLEERRQAAAERDARALVGDAGPVTIPGEAEAKAVPPQAGSQTQSAQAGSGWRGLFGDALALRRSPGVLAGGLTCGAVLLLLVVNPFGSPTPVPELVDTGVQSITGGSVATEMSDVPIVPEPIDPTSALPQTPSATVEPVSPASVLAAPPADAGLMITLRAERQCWISIAVDGGERLERLMEPEETIVLHAQDEALVKVGNAAALSVLINNTQTKPLGRDGQVVTMRINHATYRSYLPPRP